MSLRPSLRSSEERADWLWPMLGRSTPPREGEAWSWNGHQLVMLRGIVRQQGLVSRERQQVSSAQTQTQQSFGFKWQKRDTFESPQALSRVRSWLVERYGDMGSAAWWADYGREPLVVDAGCGAAMSALEMFAPVLGRIRYLGVDISEAVDVARQRFADVSADAGFLQADICKMPLVSGCADVIFSEGVLHHTDSTEGAIRNLAPLLRPGGRFLFYVYRRKGPVREFTDDFIREKLRSMPQDEAWAALQPLTKLGIALGELKAEVDVPEPIELLGIPAGRIDVQRLFYWHVAKIFYREDYSFDEMNHINFDWYAPLNAHRQSPEEVRAWCESCGLEIERERVEEAGITIIARKA